jgi:hypothetical protein
MTTPEQQPPALPARAPAPARRKSRRLLRHFLMQLAPVTAGILIALLIDGLLELRREEKLVAEAHAAIAAEIADNAKQLETALPSLDTVTATLYEMLGAIDEILTNGTTTITHGSFGMIMPRLTRASWDSAERTGALNYMDYEQVRRYAGMYAGQDAILTSYGDLARRFPTLGSIGETLQSKDRATRRDDLGRGRAVIAEFLIAIGSHRAMADGLRYRYQTIPCYADECPEPPAAPSP